MKKSKPPVIVLGMHRSGTSLLAELLTGMGIFMGTDLEENRESRFFTGINEWLLNQAGVSWQDPGSFKYVPETFRSLMAEIIRLRMQSSHSEQYLGEKRKYGSVFIRDTPWGWKDPRNTFTWSIWKELFPEAFLVHIVRNPVDVCVSLVKRENDFITATTSPLRTRTGLRKKYISNRLPGKRLMDHPWRAADATGAFEMWKDYVSTALLVGQDEQDRVLHLRYEDLVEYPDKQIEALAAYAGADVDSDKMRELIGLVKHGRRYAFIGHAEYESFYREIKDDPLVVRLGYHNILDKSL